MTGFNPRCLHCGATRFVSIGDLYKADQPGIDPASGEAWELRYQRIPKLAGRCECGGSFSVDAPIRCPECLSRQVTSELMGLVD
jgi:hypothetical protein